MRWNLARPTPGPQSGRQDLNLRPLHSSCRQYPQWALLLLAALLPGFRHEARYQAAPHPESSLDCEDFLLPAVAPSIHTLCISSLTGLSATGVARHAVVELTVSSVGGSVANTACSRVVLVLGGQGNSPSFRCYVTSTSRYSRGISYHLLENESIMSPSNSTIPASVAG